MSFQLVRHFLFLVAPAALLFLLCLHPVAVVLAQEEPVVTCSSPDENHCSSSIVPQKIRILCYGDSLTAGESPPHKPFYPYAKQLRMVLAKSGIDAKVDHIGLCGWTTDDMLRVLDDPEKGLRRAISKQKIDDDNDDYDRLVVIILAGTNDLWPQNLNPTQANIPTVTDRVLQNLLQLHRVAWEFPRTQTVAIGIPSSMYQIRDNLAARQVRLHVNQQLQEIAYQEPKMVFLPFPFDYDPSRPNWSNDGIHFSKTGYQALGESVAHAVLEKVLGHAAAAAAAAS